MIKARKHRYLLVVSFPQLDMLDKRNAMLMLDSIRQFVGYASYAFANPIVIKVFHDNMFVLRCNRGYEKQMALALAFSRRIGDLSIAFCTIKTSGTIKTIKELAGGISLKS